MSKLGQVLLFCGLIFLILAFVTMRVFAGSPVPFMWVALGIGIVCILGAVFKDIQFYIDLAGQRTTKHGMNLGALVVLTVAIVVGINFMAFRHVKKFDYTKEKLHSLSDQTKNILKSLDSDLTVRAFYAANQPGGAEGQMQFKDIADLYSMHTSKINVTYIDPIRRPDEAKNYEINSSGTIQLEYKGHKAKFEDISEQGFTNAIIKITRDKNKTVYFVKGHGERNIEDTEATGAQAFKKYLSDSSYEVKTLSFVENQTVPQDAAVVIVLGPQQPFFEGEIAALRTYLYNGGKLFLALDPGTKTNLGTLTKELGVEFTNSYILDPAGQRVGGGGATAVGMVFSPTSEITKDFQAPTVFHIASPLKTSKNQIIGLSIEEIVKSSDRSFSKHEIKEGIAKFIEGKDEKGPLTIVDVVTGKMPVETGRGEPKEFQAVISGDSDFLTNQLIDAQLNHDLALNSIAFLAKDKELVSIRPKTSEGSMINMTQSQSTLLYYGLIGLLPAAIFSAGGFVWYRRRLA